MKYGYYEVAGKQYASKLQAIEEATPNGWWPHWNFHEKYFSLVDWSVEPEESLSVLYQRRAKEIREQHSRVYLHYSGGSDSWQVAYSFLTAGLKIDRLIYRSYEFVKDFKTIGAENLNAEGKLSAYPSYKALLELDPTLKWETWETGADMVKLWANTKLDTTLLNIPQPSIISRLNLIENPFNLTDQSTANIYGIEKPNLYYEDGNFYLFFPDHAVNFQCFNENNQNNILFFWDNTPAAIDILKKQVHLVKKWFLKNPQHVHKIASRKSRDADWYNRVVANIVYPDYKLTWQTKKPARIVKIETTNWFYQISPDQTEWKAYQAWRRYVVEQSERIKIAMKDFPEFQKKEEDLNVLPTSWSKLYKV